MRKTEKKGQILAENIIFIVLNLIFLAILIIFIYSKSGSEAVLEEKYAKQIALIIDSAKPGMQINLSMEDAVEKANKNGLQLESIVTITGNTVTVKLREGKGYSYDFFNDVNMDKLYFIKTNPNSELREDTLRIKING